LEAAVAGERVGQLIARTEQVCFLFVCRFVPGLVVVMNMFQIVL
jgi:hypothetical protein